MLYENFTAEFVGERILKIGHRLTKSEAKIQWRLFFLGTVYISQKSSLTEPVHRVT